MRRAKFKERCNLELEGMDVHTTHRIVVAAIVHRSATIIPSRGERCVMQRKRIKVAQQIVSDE